MDNDEQYDTGSPNFSLVIDIALIFAGFFQLLCIYLYCGNMSYY